MSRRPELRLVPPLLQVLALLLLALLLPVTGCKERGGAAGVATTAPEPAAGSAAKALAAGGDVSFASFSHVCAVVEDGLQCWGANGFGQLGDGSPATRVPLPVRVVGVPGPVEAVAAGDAHTCALAGGRVWCWGNNTAHQLGSARAALDAVPHAVAGLPAPVTDLAAGERQTCAVAAGGVFCWGRSPAGEPGGVAEESCRGLYGAQPCTATPERVELPGGGSPGDEAPGEAAAVAVGEAQTCALVAGRVWCWGRGDSAARAGGRPGHRPEAALPLPGSASAVAAGGRHACALVSGEVWCWGANGSGQVGDGSTDERAEPIRVPLGSDAQALAAGRSHTCALAAGRAWCWGSNAEGQVGGEEPVVPRPRAVSLPGRAVAIAAGSDVSCAALEGGGVLCWGDNDYGQLGSGDAPVDHAGPTAVGAWDTGQLRDVAGDGRISVACLGDSNTHGGPRELRGWCERLADRLAAGGGAMAWATVNRGQGGASAVPAALRPARQQLAYTLENDRPDVVILAYGTNDLLGGASPEEVLLALLQHRQQARSAGADVFVALTPPAWPASREVNEPIRRLNELIRTALPASRVIDFYTGFDLADFEDGIHLNEAGQERRARVAAEALLAAGSTERS